MYRFLHYLLTLIFSLSVFIPYYFKLTRRRIRGILYEPTEADIKRDIAPLKSLPRHISFLLLEPQIELNILARIVVWSVAAGISYLSVYDPEGILKRKREIFYEEVLHMRQEFLGSQYELNLSDKNCSQHGMTNGTGTKTARKVFVNILSKDDGKEDIVRAAKKFCTSVNNQECKPNSMSVEYFSKMLEGNKEFPDPDLAIRFGATDILNGYLPWQIKLTEFISIPSLHTMDYNLLLKALEQYSKCEQRQGR